MKRILEDLKIIIFLITVCFAVPVTGNALIYIYKNIINPTDKIIINTIYSLQQEKPDSNNNNNNNNSNNNNDDYDDD